MQNDNDSIQCIHERQYQREITEFDWIFNPLLYVLNVESIYLVDPREQPISNVTWGHGLIHSSLVALGR